MANTTYREKVRKQHVILSILCLYKCWKDRADVISLNRRQVTIILDINRVEDKRIKWMQEDFAVLFSFSDYSRTYSGIHYFDFISDNPQTFESISFGRNPILYNKNKHTSFKDDDTETIKQICQNYDIEDMCGLLSVVSELN